ncbi:MAG: helix-turn-helix domain-containing protein [Saprospiraceae bacterium]|nr:helix-turn-helix domain-containing protein [Saprospiraceae bacterium]
MNRNAITVKNKLDKDQLFKISRFKEKIKRTKPHKHDGYYELIYLCEGEGFHWVDTGFYRLDPPEIYFLKPGRMHCWQFTSIPRGYVVLFKEEYFDSVNEQNILNLLRNLDGETRLSIPEDYPADRLFSDILSEHLKSKPYRDSIIHGYLQVLLSKILQLGKVDARILSKSNDLWEQFQKSLSNESSELHLVKEYAQHLNTSPQNLNAVCQRYGGASASDLINEQVILEAKRHILHTDHTIAEVAFTLNFNDPSYFVKFFKKHTGLTPAQFRKTYFQ